MTRIVIVDDSLVCRKWIEQILAGESDLEIIGEAADGDAAADLVERARPDVVIMDLAMPNTDGFAATRRIMSRCPTPILILSASENRTAGRDVVDAIRAGALEAVEKPGRGIDREAWRHAFLKLLRIVSRVKPITRPSSGLDTPAPSAAAGACELVVVGASTGGPQAVATILGALPPLPCPVLIVVHFPEGITDPLVEWFRRVASMPVVVARAGVLLAELAGTVCVAEPGAHLEVQRGRLVRTEGEPRNFYTPSVDVLFESAARWRPEAALGVLLTGMGSDGAQGLLDLRSAGGRTIAQDEATSVVFGMPAAAIRMGAAQHVLPLQEIAPMIAWACRGARR